MRRFMADCRVWIVVRGELDLAIQNGAFHFAHFAPPFEGRNPHPALKVIGSIHESPGLRMPRLKRPQIRVEPSRGMR